MGRVACDLTPLACVQSCLIAWLHLQWKGLFPLACDFQSEVQMSQRPMVSTHWVCLLTYLGWRGAGNVLHCFNRKQNAAKEPTMVSIYALVQPECHPNYTASKLVSSSCTACSYLTQTSWRTVIYPLFQPITAHAFLPRHSAFCVRPLCCPLIGVTFLYLLRYDGSS